MSVSYLVVPSVILSKHEEESVENYVFERQLDNLVVVRSFFLYCPNLLSRCAIIVDVCYN